MNIAEWKDIPRESLVVNPARTCQPIGAVYAALGIHGCMPHSHGSQGCASYLRMHLSRHFREPIITTTSSFTEGQVVFGGSGNLKAAIRNLIHIYEPKVVAVHTTCSAETIGDDVSGIIEEMKRAGELPEEVKVFCAGTPSYVGSHITGYSNMVKAAVETFAEEGEPSSFVNLLPGFVSPGDVRELKRMLSLMGIGSVVLPDVSGVLDAPMTGELKLYQEGGTKVKDIARMGSAHATIALGREAGHAAGMSLKSKFGIPLEVLPVPVGIGNVDAFLMALSRATGKAVPAELEDDRGRLVDMMLDAHAHWYGAKVAVFGDPDITEALTGFVVGMGMEPVHVLTGTRSKAWEKSVSAMLPQAAVISGGDLFALHDLIKEVPVDLLIGNSYGKYIARPENIPLVRVGFPIVDRANLQHFPTVGYAGASWLVERIGNTLLDWKENSSPDHLVELVQ
ncbi:MAG: nitrogenase molybdenum-iron protein subunit beta [Candidatus Aquicultorales bacterium]